MSRSKDKTYWIIGSGPGLLVILLVGSALAYVLSLKTGNLLQMPAPAAISLVAIGLAWSLILLSWLDLLNQGLALFSSDPIPAELDLSQRSAIRAHLETLSGSRQLTARSVRLLEALAHGASASQVMSLASFQSEQAKYPLRAGATFTVILLAVCIWLGDKSVLSLAALVVLAITLYARANLLARIDHYLETHLLGRLPSNLPGTGVTAGDLAEVMGQAVRDAFKQYIPQPEQMAMAISGAATGIEKGLNAAVGNLSGGLDKGADKLQESLNKHIEQLTQTLGVLSEKIQFSTQGLAARIDEKLVDVIAQLMETYRTGNQSLQTALTQHVQQIGTAGGSWSQQLGGILTQHAEAVNSANQQLSGQLDKIMALEKDVQKVLHIQEAVDGTLRDVTTSQEFMETLRALRQHVQESDKLIREATRPRKIRLVEQSADADVLNLKS